MRLARDFSAAKAMSLRMFEILKSRNENEGKEIVNILKKSASEVGNYESSERSIKNLIDKIIIKSIEEKKK